MKLTVNDKKILVAFGCPNLETTIDRLRLIGALAAAPETRKAMFTLALKLTSAKSQQDYQDFFYILKLYSEEYRMKVAQIQQFQPDLIDASLRKRLVSFAKKHPELCRQTAAYDQGGAAFIIDKSRLSIRLVPPYSEERKQKVLKSYDFRTFYGPSDWIRTSGLLNPIVV